MSSCNLANFCPFVNTMINEHRFMTMSTVGLNLPEKKKKENSFVINASIRQMNELSKTKEIHLTTERKT